MNNVRNDPYLPEAAEIIARRQESPSIFSIDTCFHSSSSHKDYTFQPGQFNMIYLYGVGEVAISISSDPAEKKYLTHTIRAVGRVTKALQKLKEGDVIGVRGPYGKGWPVEEAENKDVIIVTGGLGCAPTVSVINYMMARRKRYGNIKILQGVKHSDDFIFRQYYDKWKKAGDTQVYIAADQAGPKWPWITGFVTDMIKDLPINAQNTIVMMCGPEAMMGVAVKALVNKGMDEENLYLSMERNMECGLGHCGHCQYGGVFICKDGPVFAYPTIKALFSEKGF